MRLANKWMQGILNELPSREKQAKPYRGEQSTLVFFNTRGRLLSLDVIHGRAGLPRWRDFAGMRIQTTASETWKHIQKQTARLDNPPSLDFTEKITEEGLEVLCTLMVTGFQNPDRTEYEEPQTYKPATQTPSSSNTDKIKRQVHRRIGVRLSLVNSILLKLQS